MHWYGGEMTKVNQILREFVETIYREGKIKRDNWEITIPVPWGDRYAEYGLTQKEAKCLRLIMLERANQEKALFDYNAKHKCWHLDLYFYPRAATALAYVDDFPISDSEYQAVERQYLEADKQRKYPQRV